MKALKEYRSFVVKVDDACHCIQERYAEHVLCEKRCAGNCCRIHLSVFAIEAFSLARALKKLPASQIRRIRQKARRTNTFGPCPLLEKGACLMYGSRLVICRTHGLPMRSEYRGIRSIGFCQKNFQKIDPVPEDAVIDLNRINYTLAAFNRMFMDESSARMRLPERLSIAKALLFDL